MELLPGVHQVDGVTGANVYLLVRPEGLVLVDTGLPGNAGPVLDYLRALGHGPHDVAAVLLTHAHLDHAGSAAALRERTRARVALHCGDTVGRDGARLVRPVLDGTAGAVSLLLSRLSRYPASPVDMLVEDGREVVPGVVALHTPGHTPGSVCYLVPERGLLLTGDMILNNGDHLSRPLPYGGADVAQYEASLRRLASLGVERALFGHGPPLREGAGEAIRRLAERPPNGPAFWRALRNWRRLIRFAWRLQHYQPYR